MKTGWRHNDHQTQREFERFRKQSTVETGAQVEAPGVVAIGGTTTIIPNQPGGVFFELDAYSPWNTCEVTVENTGTKAILTIDRFLTVAVNSIDIITRLSANYTNPTVKTVKRINFIEGKNVVLNGSNSAEDEVTIIIDANPGVPGTGTMNSWFVQTNADPSEEISDGETVTFLNGKTTYWSRTGNNLTVQRPLTLEDDGVAVGDDDVIIVNYDSNGATGNTYIEWEVVDIGAGERRVRAKYNPNISTIPYVWNLVASATPSFEPINDTDSAIFTGRNGIRVTRVVNEIIIERDPQDPGTGTNNGKRIYTGELVFSNTAADYIGTLPAYRYGTRQYVDIVHNWNLSNLNNFHLELVDRALDTTGTNIVYYRSGTNTIWGGSLGNQAFRNIPHWAALDRNTVRVWATMSRLKPTEMRFRFTVVEL